MTDRDVKSLLRRFRYGFKCLIESNPYLYKVVLCLFFLDCLYVIGVLIGIVITLVESCWVDKKRTARGRTTLSEVPGSGNGLTTTFRRSGTYCTRDPVRNLRRSNLRNDRTLFLPYLLLLRKHPLFPPERKGRNNTSETRCTQTIRYLYNSRVQDKVKHRGSPDLFIGQGNTTN